MRPIKEHEQKCCSNDSIAIPWNRNMVTTPMHGPMKKIESTGTNQYIFTNNFVRLGVKTLFNHFCSCPTRCFAKAVNNLITFRKV